MTKYFVLLRMKKGRLTETPSDLTSAMLLEPWSHTTAFTFSPTFSSSDIAARISCFRMTSLMVPLLKINPNGCFHLAVIPRAMKTQAWLATYLVLPNQE